MVILRNAVYTNHHILLYESTYHDKKDKSNCLETRGDTF